VSRNSQLVLKRGFDFLVALVGLIALFPVFVLIALCVWIDSPGPVFFRLRMAGRGGKAFDQWKFRTMVQDARQKAHPFETSATDPRITRAGPIRASSDSASILRAPAIKCAGAST